MRHSWSSEGGAVVVGDSAEDFALAYAYERLLGFGVWLSPEMLKNEKLAHTLQTELAHAAMRVKVTLGDSWSPPAPSLKMN